MGNTVEIIINRERAPPSMETLMIESTLKITTIFTKELIEIQNVKRIKAESDRIEHECKTSKFLDSLEENYGEGKYGIKVYSRPINSASSQALNASLPNIGTLFAHESIVIQYKKDVYLVIEWAQGGLWVQEHREDKSKVVGTCIRIISKATKLSDVINAVRIVTKNKRYDLLSFNCQHFVSEIESRLKK